MSDLRNDQQLISAYLGGEEAAFRNLVDRHLRAVYSFVCRLMGDRSEAEDVTQEVFLRVWKNLRRYRSQESFKVWLYAIARNASVDWLRRKRPAVFSDFDGEDGENVLTDSLADPGPLPDELAALAADSSLLAGLVERLPANHRAAVSLRRDGDLTFEEVAMVLRKPVDTVKSLYRRSLARLRQMLEDELKARRR